MNLERHLVKSHEQRVMTERTILNQVGFISRVYLQKLFLSIGRNTFSRGLLIARVNKFARARARAIARVKRKGLIVERILSYPSSFRKVVHIPDFFENSLLKLQYFFALQRFPFEPCKGC